MMCKSSRRDFLKGRPAADAMGDTIRDATSDEASQDGTAPSGESYFVRVTRRAMACEFEIRFNAGRYERGTEAALAALDLVETVEDQLSVFRQSSEICRVNQTAAEEPVEIEPRLLELLEMAMRLHVETGGAFDLSCGPLSEAWGFARRDAAVPHEKDLAEAMRCVGWQFVELDRETRTIRFRQPGVGLNLGSIGKGYALDRCAQVLVEGGRRQLSHPRRS